MLESLLKAGDDTLGDSKFLGYFPLGVAFLGFWTVRTVLNPISGQDFDEGPDECGVLHSARWHDGDWMVDGIREAWLRCFIWMENFQSFNLAESLVTAL
ncbi:uncharacterized protein TNCV_2542701 [Trichonephila clavipes]|nr:uncharacterized protein TNCV_2542701 [Trichonephila clavipes]